MAQKTVERTITVNITPAMKPTSAIAITASTGSPELESGRGSEMLTLLIGCSILSRIGESEIIVGTSDEVSSTFVVELADTNELNASPELVDKEKLLKVRKLEDNGDHNGFSAVRLGNDESDVDTS
jgi:hypothetical protein